MASPSYCGGVKFECFWAAPEYQRRSSERVCGRYGSVSEFFADGVDEPFCRWWLRDWQQRKWERTRSRIVPWTFRAPPLVFRRCPETFELHSATIRRRRHLTRTRLGHPRRPLHPAFRPDSRIYSYLSIARSRWWFRSRRRRPLRFLRLRR